MSENTSHNTFPGYREPEYQVTDALDTDYYEVFTDIPAADRAAQLRAREFAESVKDKMAQAWDDHHYPLEVAAGLGEAGLMGDGLDHPDVEKFTPLASGLINMELARVDGSLGTVLGVQGGLALRSLVMFGSKEQQDRYVKPLAAGTLPGAFALTEPDHGSDSVSLETTASRQDDGSWVLRGAKKWIGNGAAGGISFVWARVNSEGSADHGKVRCFIVPQEAEGYNAEVITGKGSLRAIDQALILLDDVALPADAVLEKSASFKDASAVLFATRTGVAWSALGHAVGCFEAALSYAQQRTQFGKPLVQHQLVQERLTRMLSQLTTMQMYCAQSAELEAAGTLRAQQASLAKYHNTRTGRQIAAEARDLLGGNGILVENGVIRHQADLEALITYEGTESMQALIVGRDITGTGAFA